MKARQDFVMYVSSKSNKPRPHKSGESLEGKNKIKVLKGKEIPKEIEELILRDFRDFADIPKEILKDLPKPEPRVTKREYSMENLVNKSLSELKKIGAKFTPPITDRSADRLRSEILTAQERIKRTGK